MAGNYGVEWEDDQVRRAMKEAPETYRRVMRPALSMMLQETRIVLVKNSPGRGGGEGNLASSWQILQGFGGSLRGDVRAGVPYAYYADKGRKPGKMPPYDPIEQWVHRLGLGERASGKEREAARPRHMSTKSRKARKERSSWKPKAANGDEDRETIIYRIRRKIGEHGTYTPDPPPKFVDKSHKQVQPRLQQIYMNAVDAFVDAVST